MNNKKGGDTITFQYRYRKQILSVIIIILLIGGSITYYVMNQEKPTIKKDKTTVEKKVVKKEKEEKEIEMVSVDIKGEVNIPGIYSVEVNSRVIDVISQAGGLTENADTTVINLSKKVKDEMVIIIYSKEQVAHFEETKKQEEYLQNKCIEPEENSIHNDACIQDNQTTISGKVNINTATQEELMTLTGIGASKAKDIISYRETNGPFTKIEDLKNVPGIGDSIFARIQENITV